MLPLSSAEFRWWGTWGPGVVGGPIPNFTQRLYYGWVNMVTSLICKQ